MSPNLRNREGSDHDMVAEYKARCELHARLLAEHHAIAGEHTALKHKPFDADEHRRHLARLQCHLDALAAYREWTQRSIRETVDPRSS